MNPSLRRFSGCWREKFLLAAVFSKLSLILSGWLHGSFSFIVWNLRWLALCLRTCVWTFWCFTFPLGTKDVFRTDSRSSFDFFIWVVYLQNLWRMDCNFSKFSRWSWFLPSVYLQLCRRDTQIQMECSQLSVCKWWYPMPKDPLFRHTPHPSRFKARSRNSFQLWSAYLFDFLYKRSFWRFQNPPALSSFPFDCRVCSRVWCLCGRCYGSADSLVLLLDFWL